MIEHVTDSVGPFVVNINRGLDELNINRSLLVEMDHVCYRVETTERYRELLDKIGKMALLLGENMVGGRPIATFRLHQPVETGGWNISYLELPAPKAGSPYEEGLEHAEFVVLGGNLEYFQSQHPHLQESFSYKGMEKPLNPELGLKAAGISVKFHELALGKVVRLENILENY